MSVNTLLQETNNKSPELKASAASAANEAKGNIEEHASEVSQKAQDWATNVANKAQETASAALDKTNDGIAAVGQQMNALGGTVRKAAPQDGVMCSVATAVADKLQEGGRYLGHGLQDMGKDLTSMVRQYPIPSVLVGFGLGCLLGMTLRRR